MEQTKNKISIFRRLFPIVLAIGILIYFLRGCGTEIGRIAVEDEFNEIQINIKENTEVIFWTELRVLNKSHNYEYAEDLPHLLDYEIEVKQNDKLLYRLKCNPFNSNIFSTTSTKGSTDRDYVGKINGCTMNAPGGLIIIRAKRKWLKRDERFNFKKTDLIIKK